MRYKKANRPQHSFIVQKHQTTNPLKQFVLFQNLFAFEVTTYKLHAAGHALLLLQIQYQETEKETGDK